MSAQYTENLEEIRQVLVGILNSLYKNPEKVVDCDISIEYVSPQKWRLQSSEESHVTIHFVLRN